MGPSGASLALALASQMQGKVLWIGEPRHARALRAQSCEAFARADRFILIQTANRGETLWAGEEAMRCKGAELVVLHVALGPDLFESRRLQIAAQVGGTLGLILIGRRAQSSAAQSRWSCQPSPHEGADWVWRSTKNRRARPGAWRVSGDPPPAQAYPLDLLPTSLTNAHPDHVPAFTLQTAPCPLPAATPAGPLVPAGG
ncbi:hypothetical protein GCM10007854_04440 [Algimonas porphyrae]|uniref:Uncharacterized protein n=2 Tax=Algimonas porphyrae TaxID=1128113 RepID=A0ABQ5UW31_9PROT|nr:hypothetical protein GCM10007854_04440 [Algimonas porphyrae]